MRSLPLKFSLLVPSIHATCPAHHFLLGLITPGFGKMYKLRRSLLSSFRHRPVSITANFYNSSYNTELSIHYLARLMQETTIFIRTLITRLTRRALRNNRVMDDCCQAVWFKKWWEGKSCPHIDVEILSENEEETRFVFPRPDAQTHSWCSVGIPPRHHGGAIRTHLHEEYSRGTQRSFKRYCVLCTDNCNLQPRVNLVLARTQVCDYNASLSYNLKWITWCSGQHSCFVFRKT
jgi:hypothetical protein